MLKDIIEKMEEQIQYYINRAKEEQLKRNTYYFGALDKLSILKELLPDLKKEAELQEEMATALVKSIPKDNCYKINNKTGKCYEYIDNEICYNCCIIKTIKLIEKYYNKKWEEIIK
jgi:hypothetical protein